MGLNKVKQGSQMYQFIDATWNIIKGKCFHSCSYCYMKRWGKLNPTRFDKKELKTNLGSGNFIFVGSSNDMFADNIQHKHIIEILEHCCKFDNSYLFQSKNPERMIRYQSIMPVNSVLCTTIESNIWYPEITNESPLPIERMRGMQMSEKDNYITIEPIMKFNLNILSTMIKLCNPVQVNIGGNTSSVKLPEPSKEEILELITKLEKFTIVNKKKNLNRLLK